MIEREPRLRAITGRPTLLARQNLTVAGLALIALLLLALIGRDVVFPPAPKAAALTTSTVQTGTVRQAVSGTGNVEPAGQTNVSFRVAGVLAEVNARPGEKVSAGQILARLDPSSQLVAVEQAQANLASAQANLASALAPVTPQQLAQLQHSVDSAQNSYNQTVAQVNLTNQQDAAQVPVDQAQLNSDQNQLNSDQNQQNSDQNQVNADQSALNFNSTYQSDNYNLNLYKGYLATDTATFNSDGCGSQTYPYSGQCATDFNQVSNDQRNVNTYQTRVNNDSATLTADQAKLTADQAKVSSDQAKVSADNQKLASDQNKIAADQLAGQRSIAQAQAAIVAAQDSLAVQTTAKSSSILAAQASVQSSQAQLDTANQNLNYTVLSSPVTGTVISVNGVAGETVGTSSGATTLAPGSLSPQPTSSGASSAASSSAFMTIASDGGQQVVVPFAESDAAKVAAAQTATVTFDAVSGLSLPAHVVAVAAASTIVSNVVNYYATLALDRADPRVKQGMTANVSVVVAQAQNVLVVPNRALTRLGPLAFVNLLNARGQPVRTPVQLGAQGDTTTEIRSGLQAGDKVVLPTLKAPSGTTNRGGGAFGGGGVRVGGG